MTNEDLYRVLAHVDPAYLEHSERTMVRQHRALRSALAAAAVIAVLTCTAFAIPAVRSYLMGLASRQTHTAAVADIPGGQERAYTGLLEVYPEITIPDSAPQFLETFYVPLYLAQNWQSVPKQTTNQTAERVSTFLQWQSEDGAVVSFCQEACPGYHGDYAFEIVEIGYQNSYTISRTQYGGLDLWTVAVGPSQAETADGLAADEGFRKFYWSDGLYLLSLETPYDAEDALLEQIFASVSVVDDITLYEDIEYVEPVQTDGATEPAAAVWFPAELPEGFALESGILAGKTRACYEFVWVDSSGGTLELRQMEDWEDGAIRSWETMTQEHTKEVVTVGGWEVTVYSAAGWKTEAMWQTEDGYYDLVSRGALTPEALVQVIESLEILEDPAPYLTR